MENLDIETINPEHPIGGMLEHYDIEREKKMIDEAEAKEEKN